MEESNRTRLNEDDEAARVRRSDAEVEGHKKGLTEDGEGKKGLTEDEGPEVEGHIRYSDLVERKYKKG
jgi:hypothetical protein